MHPFTQRQQRLQAAVKHGWISFIQAARPHRRKRRHRGAAAADAVDPVALTMMAVNRLGPATLRTATNGKALTVAVPDARTAEIFRAALTEMQKTRRTDRLVAIVVNAEAGLGQRAQDGRGA